MIAFTLSLPTVLDVKHAAIAYAVIVCVAVLLWIVCALVGTVIDVVGQVRAERRAYVVRRFMESEEAKR